MQQRTSSARFMAMDLPPPQPAAVITQTSDLPVISSNPMGQPSGVRYSDFLKLVNADKIEKVTFSADGSQLLGVDVDGSRLKIDTLPNDPDLLAQLTSHKVCCYCFCLCLEIATSQIHLPFHLSFVPG